MRRSSILFNLLGAVGLVALLSGCSGGGGSSAGTTTTTGTGGATTGTAAASGTITGFGSVFVNGKKFETNNVEVIHDGQWKMCSISPNDHCGLKEGMTVTVSGTFNGSSQRASSITQEDTLEGPIQSKAQVDRSNGTLTILGQTVLVNDSTKFDASNVPNKLDSLLPGNVVEVSGFVKDGPTGLIVASFIEKKTPATNCDAGCEIKGVVKGHNHNTTTFQIGGLTVNYAPPASIVNMPLPDGSNWDDLFVEVKGSSFNSGTLNATNVEPENQGGGNNIDEFEVEGFVTMVDGPGDFFIGTTHVQTTTNTQFLGGAITDIVVGARLSADGPLASGILTAKHVIYATATWFGFDVLSRDGYNATPTGDWLLRGADLFATITNSAITVRGNPTATLDDKGRPRFDFPEFTFQGVNLSNDGNSTFVISGYRTGDDRLPTFSFTAQVSGSLQVPNSLLDDSGRPMNVKIDELIITGVNGTSSEFGVGCLGVGTTGGAPACPLP